MGQEIQEEAHAALEGHHHGPHRQHLLLVLREERPALSLDDCYSPWLLKDMDRAVEQVLAAIESDIRIRVIGDYDVDGICASYILTKGLQILGAKADTAIPHRIHDGYGLNDHLIEMARLLSPFSAFPCRAFSLSRLLCNRGKGRI